MLRLDINTNTSYRIPPTNPFGTEVWSYGLRNPWRWSFDRLTGDLIIGDVGQTTREEIDFQSASSTGGENYGWHCMEGFLSNTCSGVMCATPAMVRPILDHDRTDAQAIVGGYRYRGLQIPHCKVCTSTLTKSPNAFGARPIRPAAHGARLC